uniref:Uncharacterized protein n=1 Tax=Timema poppense TaxID=170557 RepID=A0A7R9DMI4_TIMPO|nr:unnamed protein product [Timema poppensis]
MPGNLFCVCIPTADHERQLQCGVVSVPPPDMFSGAGTLTLEAGRPAAAVPARLRRPPPPVPVTVRSKGVAPIPGEALPMEKPEPVINVSIFCSTLCFRLVPALPTRWHRRDVNLEYLLHPVSVHPVVPYNILPFRYGGESTRILELGNSDFPLSVEDKTVRISRGYLSGIKRFLHLLAIKIGQPVEDWLSQHDTADF